MKNLCILGSTGSVGTQSLDVVSQFSQQFNVVALSAHRNVMLLAEQIRQFSPQAVVVGDEAAKIELQELLNGHAPMPALLVGNSGLEKITQLDSVDIVVNGIVGFAGLKPTFSALEAGKKLLTGNKETIVTAGHLLKPYLEQIIPLDSEHSAVLQCLQAVQHAPSEVARIWLTASGGPFYGQHPSTLKTVTPQQALKHPQWEMGQRISIDSATMMNKGFERIEASVLFDRPIEDIGIVIHPQSIIHSALELIDGNWLCQMGPADMRLPIVYGLSHPERWPLQGKKISLPELSQLTFDTPDPELFPCLALCTQAMQMGGSALTVLNAADEIAVQQFLAGKIAFTEIAITIEKALQWHAPSVITDPDINTICQVDTETRQWVETQIKTLATVQ